MTIKNKTNEYGSKKEAMTAARTLINTYGHGANAEIITDDYYQNIIVHIGNDTAEFNW